MKHIIKAIARKDYHTASEAIIESLNSKAEARLLEERSQLHEGNPPRKFRDEVSICPQCKTKYPYVTAIGLANMGDDSSPCCGKKLVKLGRTGSFEWDADYVSAEYLGESDMLPVLLKRGFDLSTRSGGKVSVRCSQCEALVISGVPAHERGCPNATSTCKGCDRTVPARQKYCSDCQ